MRRGPFVSRLKPASRHRTSIVLRTGRGDGGQRTGRRRGRSSSRGRARCQRQTQADHRGRWPARHYRRRRGTWFFFLRHGGDETHAEDGSAAAQAAGIRRRAGHAGQSGRCPRASACNISRSRSCSRSRKRSRSRRSSRRCRASPTFSRLICANCGPADLNGSAGLFRLKEELTRRVNAAIAPIQVNAVLFKEIVVQ